MEKLWKKNFVKLELWKHGLNLISEFSLSTYIIFVIEQVYRKIPLGTSSSTFSMKFKFVLMKLLVIR